MKGMSLRDIDECDVPELEYIFSWLEKQKEMEQKEAKEAFTKMS
jgi:hypothetical protein